ncbi:AhpC-TSA-domain-containing protein [Ramaria rubella]|nr:AhpC-TSA-domain-containing protein [Ramaria rubella]
MAPRKVSAENVVEPRRSSRIADKPKSPVDAAPKPRAKKGGKKREAEGHAEGEENGRPYPKKVGFNKANLKGSGDENGEEQDELADDDDDEIVQATTVSIGDLLPPVTLKNEKDEDVNVAELAAEKGLVLFLVPKADTPGCTKQACGFRDSYPDFTKYNFTVYCVSADTTSAQAKWQTKQELPYSLLSDRERVLIKALGAADGGKTKRSHFIFEKGGKLVDKKVPVKPVESSQQALEFITNLPHSPEA